MEKTISGIQQIGIGIPAVYEAWAWYRKAFGMDIPMFDEAAVAELMLPYTGGKPQKRHAILALNLEGGGGFEIWQYSERTPQAPNFEIQLGDLGINIAKIRSKNVAAAYLAHKQAGYKLLSAIKQDPSGVDFYFVQDPYNNIFQVIKDDYQYIKTSALTGGPMGAIIGVSNIDESRKVYSDILGYDEVVYDEMGVFDDLKSLPGGESKFRRVLLKHSKPRSGSFSQMLAPSVMELIQTTDRKARKIYEGRFWGDLGFIHICFDIIGINQLREECKEKGFGFTVDSGDFDMGEASGAFAYIEDPDGTLIEFVETHKIPIIKKVGWYLNLKNRKTQKPLPKWMLSTLQFSRKKD